MRMLVVYGSKRGGTEGLARRLGAELETHGFDVAVRDATDRPDPADVDGVVVGGALYTMRWNRAARRYVREFRRTLAAKPLWLFSSGPLDDTAHDGDIAPVRDVRRLMAHIPVRGHVTFGGRLAADATGFPAKAMAKKMAGDWRNWDDVARYADGISAEMFAHRVA